MKHFKLIAFTSTKLAACPAYHAGYDLIIVLSACTYMTKSVVTIVNLEESLNESDSEWELCALAMNNKICSLCRHRE
jgi:hypothetical protein